MSNSFATPWTVAPQVPLSVRFPRQEHWSELPCPPPGSLPDPRIKPQLLHCRLVLYHWPPGKPHNGLLLSHKNEWNCVICRHIDRPRDCHIELSQKREKQVSYSTTYMWNLGKWYRRTYLQIRNRDTDIENKLMDTKGKGRVGWLGRLGLTYTQPL